jgi:hypothetical protein
MILILIIFTHSLSHGKIKLIMSKKQYKTISMETQFATHLVMANSCHSQCDDQIHYYNKST